MKVTSRINRLFEEAEVEQLKVALASDKIIMKAVLKLIEDKVADLSRPTSVLELSSQSWALSKAHTEGGRYYLEQIANIFKE